MWREVCSWSYVIVVIKSSKSPSKSTTEPDTNDNDHSITLIDFKVATWLFHYV